LLYCYVPIEYGHEETSYFLTPAIDRRSKRQTPHIKTRSRKLANLAPTRRYRDLDVFEEKQTPRTGPPRIQRNARTALKRAEACGIRCVAPDRARRNSLDGRDGSFWLVDTGEIVGLKFPSFRFDITPQGSSPLAIRIPASGKYYVDKLGGYQSRFARSSRTACGRNLHRSDIKRPKDQNHLS